MNQDDFYCLPTTLHILKTLIDAATEKGNRQGDSYQHLLVQSIWEGLGLKSPYLKENGNDSGDR